jgi:pyruvate dehydrogenase E2 component (dihydrolipoamide acetyltransferase)
MARYEFRLPDIGEGVTEGEIVGWLVAPGDFVTEDQPMVEVMTDKATVTISAPKSGKVLETKAQVGEVVKVHAVLIVFDLEAGGAERVEPARAALGAVPAVGNGAARRSEGNAATAVGDIREDLPGVGLMRAKEAAGGAAPSGDGYWNEKPLATPATRKLARDLGLDLRAVQPTGTGGRVTSEDVRAKVPATSPEPSVPVRPHAAPDVREERTPLRGVRKKIFENMALSKRTMAHFTFVEECDASALKRLRERLKPKALGQGVNLTFLPFVVKAVVAALRKHPSLNATFDERTQEIVTRRYYNIGIAAASEAGLVVPVVKDADELSLLEIARRIERFGEEARSGRLRLEDLQGSTFTITSLGQKGGLFATPIIHYPEVAILGIHQIKQKPVVRDGQIVVGDVMLVSLSFDHRLIDGHVAAEFAYEVIGYLEQPETLLLEMT